jgi:hypothetical protein
MAFILDSQKRKSASWYSDHTAFAIVGVAHLVGPPDNPIETSPYFALPFCRAPRTATRRSIGNLLVGNSLQDIEIRFAFPKPQDSLHLCNQTLRTVTASAFAQTLSDAYWALFYVDDFPVWYLLDNGAKL